MIWIKCSVKLRIKVSAQLTVLPILQPSWKLCEDILNHRTQKAQGERRKVLQGVAANLSIEKVWRLSK